MKQSYSNSSHASSTSAPSLLPGPFIPQYFKIGSWEMDRQVTFIKAIKNFVDKDYENICKEDFH